MSALPHFADSSRTSAEVREVPKPAVSDRSRAALIRLSRRRRPPPALSNAQHRRVCMTLLLLDLKELPVDSPPKRICIDIISRHPKDKEAAACSRRDRRRCMNAKYITIEIQYVRVK